jgi:serine/threonine protein kinase
VKIGDFGLSTLVLDGNLEDRLNTWQWLAPETISRASEISYDHRSDIYSFGIILWEIVTLQIPFDEYLTETHPMYSRYENDSNFLQLKYDIVNNNLRPTFQSVNSLFIGEKLVPKLTSLIEGCWDSNPANRPTSIEILNDLCSLYKTEFPEDDFFGSPAKKRTFTESRASHLSQKSKKYEEWEFDESPFVRGESGIIKVKNIGSVTPSSGAPPTTEKNSCDFNVSTVQPEFIAPYDKISLLNLFPSEKTEYANCGVEIHNKIWIGMSRGSILLFSLHSVCYFFSLN